MPMEWLVMFMVEPFTRFYPLLPFVLTKIINIIMIRLGQGRRLEPSIPRPIPLMALNILHTVFLLSTRQ